MKSYENNMKIGLITFHRVHNYGAVLQAYSMQKTLEERYGSTEIIDFSKKSQRDYTSLYPMRNGIKSVIKNIINIPKHFARTERAKKFNFFIEHNLNKSNNLYEDEDSLYECNNNYDLFFTGSDQVWNTKKSADYSKAYFLDFVEKEKCKLCYAPSIGSADCNDLLPEKQMLLEYRKLSCREIRGATVLGKITGRNVDVVLDPTLIVNDVHLVQYVREINDDYIFYYSLDGYDKRKRNMALLKEISQRTGLKVKLITPEWIYHSKVGKQQTDAGIEEFLSLIYNAKLVCTNSFHGTALSIRFNKQIFVLEDYDGKDDRKRSLLTQLGIQDRIISSIDEYEVAKEINYEQVNQNLNLLQNKSFKYLDECINLFIDEK